MTRLTQLISRFHQKRVMVIGDIILDQYILGSASRLSPEAPVPVVVQEKTFYTPGGAANVAQNLWGLNAQTVLVGRIGDDQEGHILRRELHEKGIDTKGIFVGRGLPTICKTRIIAHHQQVVRIDREKVNGDENRDLLEKMKNFIRRAMDDCDGVIISDYGKGLITPFMVNFVRDLALDKKKVITVDPKVEHFSYYRDVTAITPNLKETENAIHNIKITAELPEQLGIRIGHLRTSEDIDLAGKELVRYLGLESLLITLGEHGMRLFEKNKNPVSIKTEAREVFDVSGAGDTVIATFTLSLTAKASKKEAADLANLAAGIVIAKLGAVAVTKQELLEAVRSGSH
ncbi:MAG: D-glycero-beta-D-manno-heptose-7-phosphate kinase [Candidatus Omnitrophica bacterium]|nr:D-glycero-beta-D-manno-heptose-7-phosphate kinase [Candidatus Omnitrophota bacterium]